MLSYLFVSHHHLPGSGLDVGCWKLFMNVSAVVMRKRIFEPPSRPIFDVENAADAMLTMFLFMPQLQQIGSVQTLPVVNDSSVG